MKTTIGVAFCLLCLCLAGTPRPATAQGEGERPKSERFGALAHLPHARTRLTTASVDLYVKEYTSDAEAKELAGTLREGGPEALLKALEKADSKGKITLTGRVGFYDLKLIRSHQTPTGRRIIAVGHRPVGFLELYYSGRSRDYEFGILTIDLKRDGKGKEKGQGALLYAAKVKVIDGSKIELEHFGIDPIRLMSVRRL